jgi:NAD(P)-dependent dehydrogenase (short-subunit alcohol dehydrogenase family)
MFLASVRPQASTSLRRLERVSDWLGLDGRVAAVTGAASGIGRAVAEGLAQAGASVILIDRNEAGLREVAKNMASPSGGASVRAMDVTSKADWNSFGDGISQQGGRLDILANCAGIARFDRVDESIYDTYREVFAVNVEGSLLGMTTALRFMREAGTGSVINVASTASLKGNPAMASYGASKAAIVHFTRSAALELNRAGLDVRVNAVLPGFTDTGMAQQVYDRFDDKLGGREETMRIFTSGRPADPSEIANLILFLASDRASFISGSAVVVDRAQSA